MDSKIKRQNAAEQVETKAVPISDERLEDVAGGNGQETVTEEMAAGQLKPKQKPSLDLDHTGKEPT